MEAQQRFEGASVEEVLTQVRAALGANAEILEANKIRKGGIGGFFAKESFEVIAVPGRSGGSALPAGVDEEAFDRAAEHVQRSNVADLLDLADLVSGAERDAVPGAPPATPAATPQAPAPAPVARTAAPPPTPRPQTAPTPTATATSFEPMVPAEMPHLSTEGAPFNDVLQRIAADASPEIADVIERRMGSTAAVGFTGAPTPPQAPEAARLPSADGRDEVRATPALGLNAVGPQARGPVDHAAMSAQHQPVAHHQPVAQQPPVTQQQPVAHHQPVAQPTAHAQPTVDPPPLAHQIPGPSGLPVLPTATPADREVTSLPDLTTEAGRTERLLSWLERDNLPRTTLLTALRGLPQVPTLPEATGVVVVVVGERRAALRLCRQMAKDHEADPSDVVLASASYRGGTIPTERRIIDLTDAARDRRSWHRRPQPTFVAVDATTAVAAEGLTWVREVVAELEPHLVIGLASAARKTEDLAVWARHAGGFDALALIDLDQTATPYAVLALEIPVAYLAEVPATPSVWAQLLMEGSDR